MKRTDVTSIAKKLLKTVFHQSVAHNLIFIEKLKNIMQKSKIVKFYFDGF